MKGFMRFALYVLTAIAGQHVWAASSVMDVSGYPEKPVRIIVPFVAGGGTDTTSRAVAQRLTGDMGQQFVVDNRAGASGGIAMEIVTGAAADGYTLALISGSVAASSNLHAKRSYNLVDLSPISQLTEQPYVMLVANGVPARTLKELIALAKDKPGNIAYGSSGTGGMQHLAGIVLGQQANINILHIPYKGGSAVTTDLIAGQIQLGFVNPLGARPHIDAGRVRAIAVTTAKRSKSFPNLPAVSEILPGYEVNNWYGIVAPPRLPASRVRALHKMLVTALSAPDVKDRLEREGSEIVASTPEELGARIASETKRWGDVLRQAGIRAY